MYGDVMEKVNFITFVLWTVFVAVGYFQVGKATGKIIQKKETQKKLDEFYFNYMSAQKTTQETENAKTIHKKH